MKVKKNEKFFDEEFNNYTTEELGKLIDDENKSKDLELTNHYKKVGENSLKLYFDPDSFQKQNAKFNEENALLQYWKEKGYSIKHNSYLYNLFQVLNDETQVIKDCLVVAKYGSNPYLYSVNKRNEYIKKFKKIDSIATNLKINFDKLLKFAHLGDLSPDYEIKVSFSTNEEKPFLISGLKEGNYTLGYTLFTLLKEAAILDKNLVWDGEQQFELSSEDMIKLEQKLSWVQQWLNDFSILLGDLLYPEDSKNYIQMGQKTVYEIINSLKGASKKGKQCLLTLPGNTTCLLLAQVCLNISEHPKKEFIKSKIESIYTEEKLCSADGKPKQFVIDTDLTNLDASQIKKITPRLNQFLGFQKWVLNKTSKPSFEEAVKSQWQTEIMAYCKYKIFCLSETFNSLSSSIKEDFINKSKFSFLSGFDSIDNKAKNIEVSLLEKYFIPVFKKRTSVFSPSEVDIAKLYDNSGYVKYGQTSGTFRDLGKLFNSLKSAPQVQNIFNENPSLEVSFDRLKEALEARIKTKYHTLKESGVYYSKKLVLESIRSFEVFVAHVCNPDKSKVTKEAILHSFSQVYGIEISNMNESCDLGLLGRLVSMLNGLSDLDPKASLDSFFVQKQKELIESSVNEFLTDPYEFSHSAQAPSYQKEIYEYLFITQDNPVKKNYSDLSESAKKILKYFFKKFTIPYIHEEAFQFLKHRLWVLTLESPTQENNEQIYNLLIEIGFEKTRGEIDKKYRVGGDSAQPWRYAFIEQDLRKNLLNYLIKTKTLRFLETKIDNTTFIRDGEDFTCLSQSTQVRSSQPSQSSTRIRQQNQVRSSQPSQSSTPIRQQNQVQSSQEHNAFIENLARFRADPTPASVNRNPPAPTYYSG